MKNLKTFVILQTNKVTKEILIFGEIKILPGDKYLIKQKLNNDVTHSFGLEEKKYFNLNKELILEDYYNETN